jgi:hypothetical protein
MSEAGELLKDLRAIGVELKNTGGKLRWRPKELPPGWRERIVRHREGLLSLLTVQTVHTVQSLAELTSWFLGADLPAEPFDLTPWRRVTDPALFFRTLREDVARPAGPHVHRGKVLANLRLLYGLFGTREAGE